MLTKDAIDEFILSRGGVRPKSRKEYRKTLTLFSDALPELPETPQAIQAWINSFPIKSEANSQGLQPETIYARFRTVRALYKQVHLWHPEIPDPMPMVRPPPLNKSKAMRTFPAEQLYRLFSLPLCPRDRALLTLCLDVGPRAGECVNLTSQDVVPGYVVLRGKTGSRVVPISDTTYRLLDALRPKVPPDDSRHLFLGERGPLTYSGIYKVIRRLCKQAGITGRRSSPHTFRHTFATEYAAAEGCDPKVLQDILGHKDFKSTLRYIQNNPARMARNHARCTPLKVLAAAAQGSLFSEDLVSEAEEIVARVRK